MQNKFPIYIISKGRAYNPITAKNFLREKIDFFIAVEPQEYDEYCKAIPKKYVLKLPFKNLGVGSYPARNYCWEHSKTNGFEYHWLFDDNILFFMKWVNGKRRKWDDINSALKFVEAVTNKHKIEILGFEEPNFVVKPPPRAFKFNCHVYSAMLIKNNLPYRWRLKYNEDVDLCLQVLHNGGKTMSCVFYMANKVSTADKMKGGNQDELYEGNSIKKNLLKAKTIEAVWPQYSKTVIRFGRHHHLINWKQFKKC
tara:strand:+ start:595 stop:1356 length:762 start_codon:yes stop_codon:yes gene_type:complete